MSTKQTTRPAPAASALTDADRIALLRHLLLHRLVEEQGLKLYKQGKIPGSFYDGRGQEAVSVGATFALAAEDRVCPLIRDLGAHLVRGTDLVEIFAHYMGRENRLSHGREGNVHFGDHGLGVIGMVSMLPKMMLVANGMATAFKLRELPRCSLAFFGDGASSNGDWHEAMNWAGLHRLPVIYVLENNQLAYSTTQDKQFAVNPIERAAGYGMASTTVDGNDVEAVFEAVRQARERAVGGDGPTLIEAVTMRMHGHGAHDDMRYVPAAQVEEWTARDPIERQWRVMEALGEDPEALRAEVLEHVQRAAGEAVERPMPDPASATDGVFCVGEPARLGAGQAPWSGWAGA